MTLNFLHVLFSGYLFRFYVVNVTATVHVICYVVHFACLPVLPRFHQMFVLRAITYHAALLLYTLANVLSCLPFFLTAAAVHVMFV